MNVPKINETYIENTSKKYLIYNPQYKYYISHNKNTQRKSLANKIDTG